MLGRVRRGKNSEGEDSALRFSERRTVDTDGVALVAESAEQGIDEAFVAEEVCPLVVIEAGGDDGWPSPVAFLEELEKDVALFGSDIEVTKLINE